MLDPTPYRTLFPISERLAYFNHAGVSPVNTRAVAAMNEFNAGRRPSWRSASCSQRY